MNPHTLTNWTHSTQVEASELGWPPGHWPAGVAVMIPGAGAIELRKAQTTYVNGEIAAQLYNCKEGHSILVTND